MPVNATFGTVDYRENGIIAVPITFAEAVVAVKTVFKITRVSGNPLQGIDYILVGEATAYELRFTVPPDRKGSFQIAAVGDVLKTGTGVWDNVTATPLDVPYGTVVPRIVDYEIPASYALGSPVDIFVGYNVEVTGWNANNPIDNPGIFEMEGAHLGTPSAYKWVGDSRPNFETLSKSMPNLRIEDTGQYDATKNNEALLALGWQPLAPPPGGTATPDMNGYDKSDPPIWHGESGQYYLIRFSDPQEVGIFNLRERVGIVRGPVR